MTCSSLEGRGIPQIWTRIADHIAERERTGELAKRRSDQNTAWMWSLLEQQVRQMLREKAALDRVARNAAAQVRAGLLLPVVGAERILDALFAGTPSVPEQPPSASGTGHGASAPDAA